MSVTIKSNIASLQAQRRLAESSDALAKTFERLSSGMRINRASDDAAGLAISSSLNADSRVFGQAMRNVNDGLSMLGIAEGALTELSNISIRQRELATQAANGTYTLQQRRAMNTEVNALVDEFNRIVKTTDFNGLSLLDGNLTSMTIQAGKGAGSTITFGLGDQLGRAVGDGTCQARTTLVPGARPEGMAAGDFNSDGKLDLISADEASAGTSSLFLGNGDGTFQARRSVSVNRSYAVSAVDLNHDGNLDLVMSQQVVNPGTVVLLGNGDGTFGGQVRINGNYSNNFAIADFDENGTADIASFDTFTNNSMGVNLGNGNGAFAAVTSFGLFGNMPLCVAAADMNGDGHSDIVIGTTGPLIIFSGNGDGTFRAPTSLSNPGDKSCFALNDINGDGINDMVVFSTGSGQMITYVGSGDGAFQKTVKTFATDTPNGIQAGDFNGDGIVDLAISERNQNCMDMLIGNGNGTFKARMTYAVGSRPLGITTGDFNGDGVTDFATGDYMDNTVSILLANTDRVTTTPYLNINTQQGARDAMSVIDNTLGRIAAELGAIGSTESRLGVALNTLAVTRENYTAAASRITDADIAQESADLVRRQILQQSCAAVLGQANQQPALALKLLRGG